LPPPSPAEVHPEPVAAEVRDARGQPVSVSGRGMASGAPAVLRVDGVETPIVAWAGPWVVDERWWDTARHRRLARFQLLTADGVAHLATVERRQWWLVARYG
jgi:protein ImuB